MRVVASCSMDGAVTLRKVLAGDLPIFYEHQLDYESNRMAAFVSENPSDREAFDARWEGILSDAEITARTISRDGEVAGHISAFEQFGEMEVTYWIGPAHRGRGIATAALAALLETVRVRPLHARVAKDNVGSLRVLEKCGFVVRGEDRGYSNARGEEVEEYVLRLD